MTWVWLKSEVVQTLKIRSESVLAGNKHTSTKLRCSIVSSEVWSHRNLNNYKGRFSTWGICPSTISTLLLPTTPPCRTVKATKTTRLYTSSQTAIVAGSTWLRHLKLPHNDEEALVAIVDTRYIVPNSVRSLINHKIYIYTRHIILMTNKYLKV